MSAEFKVKVFIYIRRIIYAALGIIGRAWYKLKPYPVVLCYHSVNEDNWFHGVSISALELQLRWLSHFAKPVTLGDIYLHITQKKIINEPSFAVTFDDGYSSILNTTNLLEELNIKPTFFVLSEPARASHNELDSNYEFLSIEDIKYLIKLGWTLGSHSATHSDFWGLDPESIKKEISQSKKDLEFEVGTKVDYFAFPRGRYTDEILEEVKHAGYKMALSMDDGIITIGQNPLIVPRVGINRTHSFKEFKASFPPTAIYFRKLAKQFIGNVF